MTIGEAIFYLKTDRELKIDAMSSPEVAKKTCTVIAYDMGIEALEKQIPKKPVVVDIKDHEGTDIDAAFRCPKCNRVVCFYAENDIEKEYPYCHCGQALDWSDTE